MTHNVAGSGVEINSFYDASRYRHGRLCVGATWQPSWEIETVHSKVMKTQRLLFLGDCGLIQTLVIITFHLCQVCSARCHNILHTVPLSVTTRLRP